VRDPGDLWKARARAIKIARKSMRRGEPEGLHNLRVALRRTGATARALGAKAVSREAKKIAGSLTDARQMEVDRQLLTRIGKLGYLSPDAATALAARWEKLAERGGRRVARAADGRAIRSLIRDLRKRSRPRRDDMVERIDRARRKAEATLAEPLEGKDDGFLHRYRKSVKRARYLGEDLAALGVRRFSPQIEREKALQEALGRWNDLRLFRRRLADSRDEAEERGAVTLASELEHLWTSLETTLSTIRRNAIELSRSAAKVVPLERARSAGR
jgi:CHAD domain-containing protein